MTRTYHSYKSATPASVKVIRPEFQLVEVTNPAGFTSQSGHFISCGTIYGRLYFAEGCEPVGSSIKGQLIYDSRKSAGKGWVERSKDKRYEIHFICPNPNEYARLLNLCATPNMAINRVRTVKLIRELFTNYTNVVQLPVKKAVVKSQSVVSVTAVALPNHLAEVPSSAKRVAKLSCPWDNVVSQSGIVERVSIPTVVTPILALPPATAVDLGKFNFMSNYKVSTLRTRICKRWGIIHTGVADKDMLAYTVAQLTKRNISVQAVKSIFK